MSLLFCSELDSADFFDNKEIHDGEFIKLYSSSIVSSCKLLMDGKAAGVFCNGKAG